MSFESLQEARGVIAAMQEAFTEQVRGVWHSEVGKLFAEFPTLMQISWSQYTPYFNDGETCYFRSHHTYADVHFQRVGAEDEDDFVTKPQTEQEQAAKGKVEEFMEHFTDEDMEALFGDHADITVSRDGVRVDENSDHD